MEEEKASARASISFSAPLAAAAASAAPPPPPAPAPPSSSSSREPEPPPSARRQRFSVELRPGETTIVSWKKLLKESARAALPPSSSSSAAAAEAPAGAHPALESRIAPAPASEPASPVPASESKTTDAVPPSNRFSAVIEKIERLYMGQQSSDEELDDVPDDDEYDTEDSFIDDTELDEYFQVDKSATKHNGFFVNRGKLERIETVSSPKHPPKKRRRKDLTKAQSEKEGENSPNKHAKMDNVRMKAAARSAPVAGNKSLSPSKTSIALTEYCQVGKPLQNKLSAPTGTSKKKSVDPNFKPEFSFVKLPNKDASFLLNETKDVEKQKIDVIPSKELANKLRLANASSDVVCQDYNDNATSQVEPPCRKSSNDKNERDLCKKPWHKEKYGISELPDLNSSGSKHAIPTEKSVSTASKEGSSVRPKGTMLERAIRDLEKMVAESRPPTMECQETDPTAQGVKRRLPREVKQKLAKVARLAQSSQGKISEELINRLMSILGHLVQLKTLKRNLKEMVELGLSAKQQKDSRLQHIKKEVIEMIRMRAPASKVKVAEQQDGSSDDFQELRGSDEKVVLKGRYSMDDAMEDKICDLYDLYVEGMDEDKGPQIRKLYVELAELWPNGSMDNNGIKSAVSRAKERRSLHPRHKEEEKVKRKKVSPAVRMEEFKGDGSPNPQLRTVQEKVAIDNSSHMTASSERSFPNQLGSQDYAALGKVSNSFLAAPNVDRPKPEKAKRSMVVDEAGRVTDATILKKKIKGKSEQDMGDAGHHQAKLSVPSHHNGKEKHKAHKSITSSHPSNLQSSVLHDF